MTASSSGGQLIKYTECTIGLDYRWDTISSGPIMASVDEIRIIIEGVGSHAAEPHNGIDPMPVAASIILAAQAIASRSVDPMDEVALSISTIRGGEAFNFIPQRTEMSGTVRAMREEVRDHVETKLRTIVEKTAEAYGARARLQYRRPYPVTENYPTETDNAALAAAAVAGTENSRRDMPPSLGGEDFDFMLNEKPGADHDWQWP